MSASTPTGFRAAVTEEGNLRIIAYSGDEPLFAMDLPPAQAKKLAAYVMEWML